MRVKRPTRNSSPPPEGASPETRPGRKPAADNPVSPRRERPCRVWLPKQHRHGTGTPADLTHSPSPATLTPVGSPSTPRALTPVDLTPHPPTTPRLTPAAHTPQPLPRLGNLFPVSNEGDSPGTEDAVSHRRHIHSNWAVRSNAWSREAP